LNNQNISDYDPIPLTAVTVPVTNHVTANSQAESVPVTDHVTANSQAELVAIATPVKNTVIAYISAQP
jgi:hypothetical protein